MPDSNVGWACWASASSSACRGLDPFFVASFLLVGSLRPQVLRSSHPGQHRCNGSGRDLDRQPGQQEGRGDLSDEDQHTCRGQLSSRSPGGNGAEHGAPTASGRAVSRASLRRESRRMLTGVPAATSAASALLRSIIVSAAWIASVVVVTTRASSTPARRAQVALQILLAVRRAEAGRPASRPAPSGIRGARPTHHPSG